MDFPIEIAKPRDQLYLQSLATAEPHLRAQMKTCWLTPGVKGSESRYSLVENGYVVGIFDLYNLELIIGNT